MEESERQEGELDVKPSTELNGYVLDTSACLDREFVLRYGSQWRDQCAAAEMKGCLQTIASQKQQLRTIQNNIEVWKNEVHTICEEDESKRKWRIHTQRMHPLHGAPKILREQYNCESTSQAFCKFLEILCRFPRLVQPTGKVFRSFHLCEAPGHFVGALDRFLCTFHPNLQWHWEANSLNPHHESMAACDMLLDDDLIVAHPSRWKFGNDGSGDITKWDGPYYRTLVGAGFDLVTADGSLYVQDNPGDQEGKVLHLLQAEANAALRLLKPGGTLVFKMYSMFMPESRRLVTDISSRFQAVSLFKPMCSKSGNSERYLVCRGFTAKESTKNHVKIGAVLAKCEEFFSALQGFAIKTNIETFNAVSKAEVNEYKDRLISIFLKKTLAHYIASPPRDTWLEQIEGGNPWKEMLGPNYVERLRAISDSESARQFMADQLRLEMFGGGVADAVSQSDTVDVEWSKEELDFLREIDSELPLEKAEAQKIVVCGPPHPIIRHSLFTQPILLYATNQFAPEEVIDLCVGSGSSLSNYARRLCNGIAKENEGPVYVDASKMDSKRDWLWLLKTVLDHLEDVEMLEIAWTLPSTPLVLSRFSASVLTFLTILFSKFHFHDGQILATYTYPNYMEDIPKGTKAFLKEVVCRSALIHQFVSMNLLATMHPEILSLNRRQWRRIMPKLADVK